MTSDVPLASDLAIDDTLRTLAVVVAFALALIAAVTLCVTFLNTVGWPSYAVRWRRRIEDRLFRLGDGVRARRQQDAVEEDPDTLALMREDNSLDDVLLRLIAGSRERPYDPAQPRDKNDALSRPEF